ncbi:hypothetical protein [Sciscionella marina]|uniref:hypothetical protein n=1 Tax=Sciscionella marina TaxID=508770 RepID=UPI001969F22D|nr:hypothetical protein [Sciscionella marina]
MVTSPPGAFAFDSRIRACIANSFLPSVFEPWTGVWLRSLTELSGDAFDAAFTETAKSNPGTAWTFDHGQWALGLGRPSSFLDIWNEYTLFEHVERFDRPFLSIFGESEFAGFTGGHNITG